MQGVRADHSHKVRIAFPEISTSSFFSYACGKRAVPSESTGAKKQHALAIQAHSERQSSAPLALLRKARWYAFVRRAPHGNAICVFRRHSPPPASPSRNALFFSSGNECGVRKGFSPPRLRRLSPASAAESKRKFSLQNKMIAIYFIIVGYFLLHKLYFLR